MIRRLNLPVGGEAVFNQMSAARRLLGMRAARSSFELLRETYFDTTDGALRERKMALRLRSEARGRQVVELSVTQSVNLLGIVEEHQFSTPVQGPGLYATLAGTSEVATRVRAVADPAALRPRIALDIDRETRELKRGWLGRGTHHITLDQIVAHAPGVTRACQEITLSELDGSGVEMESLATRLAKDHRVESDGMDTYERIRRLLDASGDAARPEVAHEPRLGLLVLRAGAIALVERTQGLTLPNTRGSGEELAREYLRELEHDEGAAHELDLVGFAQAGGGADLEVWLHEHAADGAMSEELIWVPLPELLERVGGPRLRAPELIATLLLLVRSETGLRLLREAPLERGAPTALPLEARDPAVQPGQLADDYLDLDLSILDFNQRVLEMAEDPGVPLLERFRFLSIFASNMDEFFVVRVGRLKDAVGRRQPDPSEDLSPAQLLDLVAIRARALLARQSICLERRLIPELAARGVRVRRWSDLAAEQAASLSERFAAEIFPLLTPLSLSSSAGRSFPRLVSLGLALVPVLRRMGESKAELAYVPVPESLPRFLRVEGTPDVISVEDVIAANVGQLFQSAEVLAVHPFRATRVGDVEIDEDASDSLLASIADEVEARPFMPVIRLEVQATMPREIRAHLLKELRAEQPTDGATLTRGDFLEVEGPIDLRSVSELADLDVPDGRFPSFEAHRPLEDDASIFDVLSTRDLLVHHPYERFDNTVGRFLSEAAADPDVVAIKLTLYRTGRHSPVMDALLAALEAGKDVSVFVELKARFDEESNIEWTHRLRQAGAHVVYGVVGYKTHAKTSLVVRKEASGLRRYVHIGTGNYNAATARFYTDFGLLSADPDLGADLNDFFNELTGSAGPPEKRFRRLLVAPNSLVQEIERLIRREIEHAAAGRMARIQAKLNGLADREVVNLLYEASRAGVQVDLMVRSICTLRPGVPGLSDRVRVWSILGRFLEHARVYYFENAGQSEYFIGSADWRARNLRKRVEVATPVDDPACRTVLRAILDAQLSDPRAWVLRPDGVFERLRGEGPTSQEVMMRTRGRGDPAPR